MYVISFDSKIKYLPKNFHLTNLLTFSLHYLQKKNNYGVTFAKTLSHSCKPSLNLIYPNRQFLCLFSNVLSVVGNFYPYPRTISKSQKSTFSKRQNLAGNLSELSHYDLDLISTNLYSSKANSFKSWQPV